MRIAHSIIVITAIVLTVGCVTPIKRDLFREASGKDLQTYLVSGQPPVVQDMKYMVRVCKRGTWIYVQKVDIGGIHYETGATMYLHEFQGLKIREDDLTLRKILSEETVGREWRFSPELKKLALQQKNALDKK